jgi:hypothetical protein
MDAQLAVLLPCPDDLVYDLILVSGMEEPPGVGLGHELASSTAIQC